MAHPDLDRLLNNLLPFAQKMLKEHGEFYPFGATIESNGEVALAAGYTDSDKPESQDCIDLLADGFKKRAENGEIRACGICYDVRVAREGENQKVDAICSRLERSSGEAVDVYLPYRKGWLGRIKYDEIFATKGQIKIFGNKV